MTEPITTTEFIIRLSRNVLNLEKRVKELEKELEKMTHPLTDN